VIFGRGSQWFALGGVASLLYGSPTHPDRALNAALDRPGANGAYALAASEVSVADQDRKPAAPNVDTKPVSADPDMAVVPAAADTNPVRADPDRLPATADLDAPAAPPDGAVRLAAVDPGARVTSVRSSDECLLTENCINEYLWSVYARTPKFDTVKIEERVSATAKKKGKRQNSTKTVAKLVSEDFTWKDPDAAQKAGMSTMDFVIGGIDRDFKVRLYRLLRALDDAGLEPGITSAFRDDYRQGIATGKKAASDRSYHGGSLRGGYGHGLAADLVSVRGETRADRMLSSEELWKWIDAHGREFGIGRPYLDKDPPHVGPIDGREYADHRAGNSKHADLSKHLRPLISSRERVSQKPIVSSSSRN